MIRKGQNSVPTLRRPHENLIGLQQFALTTATFLNTPSTYLFPPAYHVYALLPNPFCPTQNLCDGLHLYRKSWWSGLPLIKYKHHQCSIIFTVCSKKLGFYFLPKAISRTTLFSSKIPPHYFRFYVISAQFLLTFLAKISGYQWTDRNFTTSLVDV